MTPRQQAREQTNMEYPVRMWLKCYDCATSGPMPHYHAKSSHSKHIGYAMGLSEAMYIDAVAKRENKTLEFVFYDETGQKVQVLGKKEKRFLKELTS